MTDCNEYETNKLDKAYEDLRWREGRVLTLFYVVFPVLIALMSSMLNNSELVLESSSVWVSSLPLILLVAMGLDVFGLQMALCYRRGILNWIMALLYIVPLGVLAIYLAFFYMPELTMFRWVVYLVIFVFAELVGWFFFMVQRFRKRDKYRFNGFFSAQCASFRRMFTSDVSIYSDWYRLDNEQIQNKVIRVWENSVGALEVIVMVVQLLGMIAALIMFTNDFWG